MLILNVSNSDLSTCSVGVGEGLQPRSKGTGQTPRQVLQSYFILLNSVTISESRGSFFDQVFHLIGHERDRFFLTFPFSKDTN